MIKISLKTMNREEGSILIKRILVNLGNPENPSSKLILSSKFILFIFMILVPNLFAQSVPQFFPATFYEAPGPAYLGPFAQTFGGDYWGDLCRSTMQVNRLNSGGSGTWINSNNELTFQFLAQRNPDFTATEACNSRKLFITYRYYQGTNFITPATPDLYQGLEGWFTGSLANLTFLDRPGTAYAVSIQFAPLFGDWQELRLLFDDRVASLVQGGFAALPAGEEEVNSWMVPIRQNGYFNFGQLSSRALRLQTHDKDALTGNPGSGIFKVRAEFDNVLDNSNGFVALDGCDRQYLETGSIYQNLKVRRGTSIAAIDPHPLPGCPNSATSFPTRGFAPSEGIDVDASSAVEAWENPLELHVLLNWGNALGSSHQQLGSYSDGLHVVFVNAYDMAGNAANFFFAFNTDRYAPCDHLSLHNCQLTLTDTLDNPLGNFINQNLFRLKLSLQENGSGVETVLQTAIPNIKIIAARQVTNGTISSLAAVHPSLADANMIVLHDGTTSFLADRSCEDLINGSSNQHWSSLPLVYSGVYNPATSGPDIGKMNINLDFTGKPDGTYWLFICTRDKANNWSMLIDTTTTLAETQNNPNRKNNKTNLSMFNPVTFDHNFSVGTDPDKIIQGAYVPNLRQRLFVDKPAADISFTADLIPDGSNNFDGGSPCSSDPCSPLRLHPRPAYLKPAEIDANGRSMVRIAYSPIGFTGSNTIQVGVKLPFDLSGIKGIHYKIGSSAPTFAERNDNLVLRDSTSLNNCTAIVNAHVLADGQPRTFSGTPEGNNWIDLCFSITPQLGSSLFIWLEDNAGNNNYTTAYVQREIFVDIVPPGIPEELSITPNPSLNPHPTLIFKQPYDEFGVKEYKVCYWASLAAFTNTVLQARAKGSCPTSADLLGQSAYESVFFNDTNLAYQNYTVPVTTPLLLGRWDFAIFARDNAGNLSGFSNIYSLTISDGTSRLNFAGQLPGSAHASSFVDKAVLAIENNYGFYQFKVKYTDLNNLAPKKAWVKIDHNGNGSYEDSEKYDMGSDNTATANNGLFWDGEVYSREVEIRYNKENQGLIRYSFEFFHDTSAAENGETSLNLTGNNILAVDPYSPNDFNGMLQVRNNYQKPGQIKKPVIIIRADKLSFTGAFLKILDQRGRGIRDFGGQAFLQNKRFLEWDLLDDWGNQVNSGIYHVIFQYDYNKREQAAIIVLK